MHSKKLDCSDEYMYIAIGLMSRVFANGAGDLSSIPDQVILKTKNGT